MSLIKPATWLELSRASNLPTVWSNLLHGMSAGVFVAYVLPVEAVYGQRPRAGWNDLLQMLDAGFLLLVGVSLIYAGGMWMNDAVDAELDATERGQSGPRARPIPGGRISRRNAGVGAALLLAAGLGCSLVYPPTVAGAAALLVAAVVVYNLVHRWRWTGWLLLPLCRGLVVWLGFLAVLAGRGADAGQAWTEALTGPAVWGVAAVMVYTGVVTVLAWSEALPGRERWGPWIGVMIAAMPVVDAGYTLAYGLWPTAAFCGACGVVSLLGQRWIAGS